jgi:hypothetical protein
VTYWVRALCTDGKVPTLGTVLAWTASHGVVLTQEPSSPAWTPEELHSRPWDSLGLWYRPDCSPLCVSIDHAEGRSSIFAGEVGWMRQAIAEFPASRPRDLVLAHLAGSRLVVAVQLPMNALDDEALWEAVSALLDYFVEHSGAIVHIERDGFYQADQLILKTPRL